MMTENPSDTGRDPSPEPYQSPASVRADASNSRSYLPVILGVCFVLVVAMGGLAYGLLGRVEEETLSFPNLGRGGPPIREEVIEKTMQPVQQTAAYEASMESSEVVLP